MTSLFGKPCPLDGSDLASLGGWYARPSKPDVTWAYCPRCDAAFQLWEDPVTGKQTLFTWRRKGEELILDVDDQTKVQDYLKHDWNVIQANMLNGIQAFLQGRFSKKQGCPNDGGIIPLVAELPYQPDSTVCFYWCVYCTELFAYLMDKDYGWQCVASFTWDKETSRYVLRKKDGKKANLDLIQERAASLPPPGSRIPRQSS